jgi:hypothetical protein
MKRARIRVHSESEFVKWGRLAEKRRNQESRFKSLQSSGGTLPLPDTIGDVTECFTILREHSEKKHDGKSSAKSIRLVSWASEIRH